MLAAGLLSPTASTMASSSWWIAGVLWLIYALVEFLAEGGSQTMDRADVVVLMGILLLFGSLSAPSILLQPLKVVGDRAIPNKTRLRLVDHFCSSNRPLQPFFWPVLYLILQSPESRLRVARANGMEAIEVVSDESYAGLFLLLTIALIALFGSSGPLGTLVLSVTVPITTMVAGVSLERRATGAVRILSDGTVVPYFSGVSVPAEVLIVEASVLATDRFVWRRR